MRDAQTVRVRNRGLRGARRQRLTKRGRLTLVALGISLAVCAGWVLLRVVSGLAAPAVGHLPPHLPPVGSAGPVASSPPPMAPQQLWEAIPTSRESFQLADHRSQGPTGPGWVEVIDLGARREDFAWPLRVEYSLDLELTRSVFRVLRRGRVRRGHVIVLDPRSGRLLAFASTSSDFPATGAYPAASLIKVVTAAAVMDKRPDQPLPACRYRGSPYRLTPSRISPPAHGREVSFAHALATSNNQCFAQLAVNAVGAEALLAAIGRFGFLQEPAPGHAQGSADAGDDDYDLGRLGCGLAGCRITPLHAVQLAASLSSGELIAPTWIDRVLDDSGRSLALPPEPEPRRIMSPESATELRSMLVKTVTSGTARSAFRDSRGRPKLGDVRVAGKTGNVSGDRPRGRFEWFVGVAPADQPTIAIAVVQVHDDLWWVNSSQVAADVLSEVFCEKGRCNPELAQRYMGATIEKSIQANVVTR